jgi:hypothetical protein
VVHNRSLAGGVQRRAQLPGVLQPHHRGVPGARASLSLQGTHTAVHTALPVGYTLGVCMAYQIHLTGKRSRVARRLRPLWAVPGTQVFPL